MYTIYYVYHTQDSTLVTFEFVFWLRTTTDRWHIGDIAGEGVGEAQFCEIFPIRQTLGDRVTIEMQKFNFPADSADKI